MIDDRGLVGFIPGGGKTVFCYSPSFLLSAYWGLRAQWQSSRNM